MSCTAPFEALAYATEDLDMYIYKEAHADSIWLNLIKSDTYPLNVGTERTVFGVGKTEPTAGDGSWTLVDIAAGATESVIDSVAELCEDNWTDVEWGFYSRVYNPEKSQLRGPVVCREDLLFSHNPLGFFQLYMHEIMIRSKREWERNFEFHHVELSRKAIATSNFETTQYAQTALTGMTCPTCELTQEMLESVALRLMDDGATNPDENGFFTWGNAGPVFSLYIGAQQSARLLRQNADLREDYRHVYSGAGAEGSPLTKRLAASRTIGNFRHIINQKPRRYTCSGGNFTLVQPYINATDEAGGSVQANNPAWWSAPYEGTDVLSTDLFVSEKVPPAPRASGIPFNHKTYMGEWDFVTGAYKWDTDCPDPNENKGRHFGNFMHAPRPNPLGIFKYGWHIIWKRCIGASFECTTCSS